MSKDITAEEISALDELYKIPDEAVVYFEEDTGKLISVTNRIDPLLNYPYIKVDNSEVVTIRSGKESFDDYKVLLDLKTKEFKLSAYYDKNPVYVKWNDAVYQIPKNNNDNDIHLIQDKKQSSWTLKISPLALKALNIRSTSPNYRIEFYVTEEDDANVLKDTLKFEINKIKNYEMVLKTPSATETVSVYSRKIFDTYGHTEI
jgi:hypothetical protein